MAKLYHRSGRDGEIALPGRIPEKYLLAETLPSRFLPRPQGYARITKKVFCRQEVRGRWEIGCGPEGAWEVKHILKNICREGAPSDVRWDTEWFRGRRYLRVSWQDYVEERPKFWSERKREWRSRMAEFRVRFGQRKRWIWSARMLLHTRNLGKNRFSYARRFMQSEEARDWSIRGEPLPKPATDLLLPVSERKAWRRNLM